jgi:hypothetical protein
VVLLTEDADVMAWARLEAMAGAASIIEAGVSAAQPAPVSRS